MNHPHTLAGGFLFHLCDLALILPVQEKFHSFGVCHTWNAELTLTFSSAWEAFSGSQQMRSQGLNAGEPSGCQYLGVPLGTLVQKVCPSGRRHLSNVLGRSLGNPNTPRPSEVAWCFFPRREAAGF